MAEEATPAQQILIQNVRLFDGVSDKLSGKTSVLVEGNKIASISATAKAGDGASLIDGGGRAVMPGIIEAHSHLALSGVTFSDVLFQLDSYMAIQSSVMARDMLMNGVTSTRDMAGEVFGAQRQEADQKRAGVQVDGVPMVLAAVREQLRLGASQIKLAAGGSVSGPSDPLDTTQFTLDELKAAVAAAENWGTYVGVHAYTANSVNTSGLSRPVNSKPVIRCRRASFKATSLMVCGTV